MATAVITAKRSEIAKAVLHYGRAAYTTQHVVSRLPLVNKGTIQACISAAKKTGAILDAPTPRHEQGRWLKTAPQVLDAMDPVVFLTQAIEAHSKSSRQSVGEHMQSVVPQEHRADPAYNLVGFLDGRARAPQIREAARRVRLSVTDATAIANKLAQAGLVEWSGNSIRRTRTWNTATAFEIAGHARELPFVLQPGKKGTLRAAAAALPGHQEVVPGGVPGAGEKSARKSAEIEDGVISRLKDLLNEYSFMDILIDYENVRAENRRLREQNQQLEVVRESLIKAGLLKAL